MKLNGYDWRAKISLATSNIKSLGRNMTGEPFGGEPNGTKVASSKESLSEFFLIGDLVELSGLEPKTVRFYEKAGLIQPERLGRYRVYKKEEVESLKRIRMFREIGMSISDIKALLAEMNLSNHASSATIDKVLSCAAMKRATLESNIGLLRRLVGDES